MWSVGAEQLGCPVLSCRPELSLGLQRLDSGIMGWVDGATWPEFLRALAQEQEGLELGGVGTGPPLPLPRQPSLWPGEEDGRARASGHGCA